MKYLALVTSILLLTVNQVMANPPPKTSDVFNYLKQNLPAEGNYRGHDKKGNVCTLIVQELPAVIKVNIMPNWGGFGILSDDSQIVDRFVHSSNSTQIKIEKTVSLGNATETSYGVLSFKKVGADQVQYRIGAVADMNSPRPHLVDCTVP